MINYVKTPLNYTGNKFRLLSQIQPFFPKNINIMVDLFCGGGTVGLNTDCNKVYLIDNNPMVIGLLKLFHTIKFEKLLEKCELIIKRYGLSNSYRNGYGYYKNQITDINTNNGLKQYNTEPYYKLRKDYNDLNNKKNDTSFIMLYILLLYSFNNDIRFNSKNEFNLPVGKTDLNKVNVNKLRKYMDKVKNIDAEYICDSFESVKVKKIIESADFIYMDPPYLIANAFYNESNRWTNESEYSLLALLDSFVKENKAFILSNIIERKGKRNEPLSYWCEVKKNSIDIISLNYSYKSASYNKINREPTEKEIIIKLK